MSDILDKFKKKFGDLEPWQDATDSSNAVDLAKDGEDLAANSQGRRFYWRRDRMKEEPIGDTGKSWLHANYKPSISAACLGGPRTKVHSDQLIGYNYHEKPCGNDHEIFSWDIIV